MRVVIVGAGLVGTQLAEYLTQQKHEVSLIEENEERAKYASNHLDCLVINDAGNSVHALEEAGIAKADALVCVTDSDEMNIITCGLAPRITKIARVRNDDYIRLNRSGEKILGIDHFVHPYVEASRSALRAIEYGALGDILSFANTSYELGTVDISPGSPFDKLALSDYRTLDVGDSLVTLIERGAGEFKTSILPTGSTVLAHGDRIHILAKEGSMDQIFALAGWVETPLRKIGIVGGGRMGTLIAEGLLGGPPEQAAKPSVFSFLKRFIPLRKKYRVVIIEQDMDVCKDLASKFPEALVLNEDISDEHFVTEERIDDLDLIVTTTESQELNIITAVYLKSRGVSRAIAMVYGSGYAEIARRLGVDVVIPLKNVVVDSILSHLMGRGITGVHRLGDGSVKILELTIGENSPALHKVLKDIKLPVGSVVMLIERQGESFIARGDSSFEANDRVILITKTAGEAEVSRFFGVAQPKDGVAKEKEAIPPDGEAKAAPGKDPA